MNRLYIVEYSLDGANKAIIKRTDKSLLSFILKNSFESSFRLIIINAYYNGILHPVSIDVNLNGFRIIQSEKGSSTIGFK